MILCLKFIVELSDMGLALVQELGGSFRCMTVDLVLLQFFYLLVLSPKSIYLKFVIGICLLGIFKVLDQYLADVYQTS